MLPLITTAGTRPWRYKMTKEEPLKHFILIFALIGMPAFFKIQFEIHIIYSWNCFSGVERKGPFLSELLHEAESGVEPVVF